MLFRARSYQVLIGLSLFESFQAIAVIQDQWEKEARLRCAMNIGTFDQVFARYKRIQEAGAVK